MTFTFLSDAVLVLDTKAGNLEHRIVHHVRSWNQMGFDRFVGLTAAFEHGIFVVATAIVNLGINWVWCTVREEVCGSPVEWERIIVIFPKKVELVIGTHFCRVIFIP